MPSKEFELFHVFVGCRSAAISIQKTRREFSLAVGSRSWQLAVGSFGSCLGFWLVLVLVLWLASSQVQKVVETPGYSPP